MTIKPFFSEPKNLYRYPVTTAHEIGLWRKDEPIHTQMPWTKTYRYVLVESEMTKYVFIRTFRTQVQFGLTDTSTSTFFKYHQRSANAS